MDIKVGYICKVMNYEQVYTTYGDFATKAGHPDIDIKKYVKAGCRTKVLGKEVRVLYLGLHENNKTEIVAIVETINSPEYLKFVIGCYGLAITDVRECIGNPETESYLFIERYLSGKPLNKAIPDKLVNELLIDAIILKNPLDIQYISPFLLKKDHYERILRKDGGLLGLIPYERRSLELCKLAIKDEVYAKKFIPQELKSLVE